MITRREALQVGAATAALMVGGGNFARALAQQRITQAELLQFDAIGNVTLLHVADIHGQLITIGGNGRLTLLSFFRDFVISPVDLSMIS